MKGLKYSFPAIRGKQAKEEFYTCMIPLEYLDRIFLNTDNDVAPEFRAQRKLNEHRIPEIKKYILENRGSYVFSALAGSIDGDVEFIPSVINEDIGTLEISMKSKILINDGQHRKAAIVAALEEDESLGEESIPVVLFKDKGLSRSQQMFTDLNKHAVTTSKSLNALYDSKDKCSILTKEMLKHVKFLDKYTDKEKDNLGKFSSKLFTLNNLVNANRKLIKFCELRNVSDKEVLDYLITYWNMVCENISEWNELEQKLTYKKSLREDYIVTQGVTILALGQLAEYFYINNTNSMESYINKLQKIDWSRNNLNDWLGCAIKNNGKINRSDKGINLTYYRIKQLIGLPLYESEKIALDRSKE